MLPRRCVQDSSDPDDRPRLRLIVGDPEGDTRIRNLAERASPLRRAGTPRRDDVIGAARHDSPATVGLEEGLDPVQGVVRGQGSAERVLYLDDGHNPERTPGSTGVRSPRSGAAADALRRQ